MTTITSVLENMDYGPAPESASVARDWLARHKAGFGHFINGAFTPARKDKP